MKRSWLAALFLGAGVACASTAPPSRVGSSQAMTEFLEQYALTYRFQLGQPTAVKIAPDGKVLFLRSGPRSFVQDLYELDPDTKKERVLLTATGILDGAQEELSAEERAKRERMRSTARGIATYALTQDGKSILVPLSGRLFLINRATLEVKELKSAGGYANDPRLSPDGKKLAAVRDGDLYVTDIASGKESQLTKHSGDDMSYGLAEFVAQEEMSRFHGYWWSPDSKTLAVQQTDTSGLEIMYIADATNPLAKPDARRYPRPGKANAKVRLGLISADGGDIGWIDWDQKAWPYLATVVWSKHGPLTLVVQNRTQTEELVLTVDPKTTKTTQILDERDAAWLNLNQTVPRWLSDERFLWTTERNGGVELELRNKDGSLVRSLTPPDFGFHRLVEVDEKRGFVLVTGSEDPKESHLFTVPLEGGAAEKLSAEAGLHSAVYSPATGLWVHQAHTQDGRRFTAVKRLGDESAVEISDASESPPFMPNLELLNIASKERSYAASIVRPRDFDPSKKYPVILSVYGGPGVRKVLASPYAYLLLQWFADHGFVVVSLDGRGTPGKGREWERAIRGNFIEVPLADQIDGFLALGAKYPELDLDRVGVFGWSFGGYFSALAVLLRPDIFKAGVAGAPVTDWLDYDTHYTERYLGLPDADPAAYANSSVLKYADRLTRPLLIVHGTSDDNVYFCHAVKLSDALFRAGKSHDFLPLAGFTHMVPDPLVTTRLYTTILEYFQQHL